MAKKAASSGKGGQPAKAGASAASPANTAPADGAAPGMAQDMTTASSTAAPSSALPLVAPAPAEDLGVLPPQAPTTKVSTQEQEPGASASEAVVGQAGLQDDVQQQPAAESATPPPVPSPEATASLPAKLQPHPAIELARSFQTPAGRHEGPAGRFYTPPPPDVRKKGK